MNRNGCNYIMQTTRVSHWNSFLDPKYENKGKFIENRFFLISRKGQPAAGRTRYPVSLDTERKRYRPHGLHCSEQCRACARLARLCSAVVPAASRRAYTSAPHAVNRKRLPNIRKKKINTRTKQGWQSWEKRDPRASFKTWYLKGLSPHKNPSP